jgi:predicted nucleic acid-binding protein
VKTWIVDTGPLVAYLNARDQHHAWAKEIFKAVAPPLHTCEAVLSEAFFLVRRAPQSTREALLAMVSSGVLIPKFHLIEEVRAVADLMRKYHNTPMALADACLVRMAEQHKPSTVITVDSDFRRYRIHGRRVIPILIPNNS